MLSLCIQAVLLISLFPGSTLFQAFHLPVAFSLRSSQAHLPHQPAPALATLQFVGPSCLTQFCPHKGEITSERKMGLKSLRGSSSISPTSNSGQKEVFHWLPETGIMFINCYIHRETGMTLG